MPKQLNKPHAAASAPTLDPIFYASAQKQCVPQPAITQAYYTSQLSKPSTKETYSCNRCRSRGLTCDSHINNPCTNCSRSNTTQTCKNLPPHSFELFFADDPYVRHRPIEPVYDYAVQRGWNLGERKQAPWETQAWSSEKLHGEVAGTVEGQGQQAPWETSAWGSEELNREVTGTVEEPLLNRQAQGWNLGQRQQAPWETSAWGSEVLNGEVAGTAKEPMAITSEWADYGNSGGADGYHY